MDNKDTLEYNDLYEVNVFTKRERLQNLVKYTLTQMTGQLEIEPEYFHEDVLLLIIKVIVIYC